MDSTIVAGETLDELASHAGIRDKIAPITARAMRGELDFESALRERVSLLEGMDAAALEKTSARIKLNPGAGIFVQFMRSKGAKCILVSGGFTYFTDAFAKYAGFDDHHGNMLQIKDGKLTGQLEGEILDKNKKLSLLETYRQSLNLKIDETMAIGDGANDLPMLQKSGLGIGYKPKPLLLEALPNCIIHGDLTAALYAQGFGETGDYSG
jgi:phosphoserine phosphatase